MDTAWTLLHLVLLAVQASDALLASSEGGPLCSRCGPYALCRQLARNKTYSIEASGVETVSGPYTRISAKLSCDGPPDSGQQCELHVQHVPAFSTQHSSPVAAGIERQMEAMISQVLGKASTRVYRHSHSTSNSSDPLVCRVSGQQTVHLAVSPRYYAVQGSIAIGQGPGFIFCVPVTSKVPLVAPDGSIAGHRRCISRATANAFGDDGEEEGMEANGKKAV